MFIYCKSRLLSSFYNVCCRVCNQGWINDRACGAMALSRRCWVEKRNHHFSQASCHIQVLYDDCLFYIIRNLMNTVHRLSQILRLFEVAETAADFSTLGQWWECRIPSAAWYCWCEEEEGLRCCQIDLWCNEVVIMAWDEAVSIEGEPSSKCSDYYSL